MIIRENNLQKWLFDYFEGNLTPLEEIELKNFVRKNPEYQSEFEAWEKSYNVQKESKSNRVPIYAGTSALLVETSIWARFNWRMAAAIAIILGSVGTIGYLSFPSEKDVQQDDVAITENIPSENVIVNDQVENTSTELLLSSIDESNIELAEASSNNVSEDNFTFDNHIQKESSEGASEIANTVNGSLSLNLKEAGAENQESSDSDSQLNNVSANQNTTLPSYVEKIVNLDRADKEVDKAIPIKAKEIQSSNERKVGTAVKKKKNKRYYYSGFKNVAGRGIGANKKDKEKRESASGGIDPFISENRVHETNNVKPERKQKKTNRNNMDLALSNFYDPIFIQSSSHPLKINSALAGQVGLPRLKMSNRLQNNNSSDQFYSSALSFDMFIDPLKAGVGVIAEHRNFGSGMYKNSSIGLIYAQKFEINRESSFTTAVKYTVGKNSSKTSEIEYNSQVEFERGEVHNTFLDNSTINIPSKMTSDLGIGAWYDGEYIYGGFNVDNILQSNAEVFNEEDLGKGKPVSFSAQVGTDYRKSDFSNWVISPQISYTQNGLNKKLWVGSTFKFRSLVGGVGAGTIGSNSLKGMLGIQNNTLRVNYNIDLSSSSLESGMFISHEISLRVLFGAQRNNWSRF